MKYKFTLSIFLLFSQIAISQNLLTNGDFENYTSLPFNYGQTDLATGWNNVNGFYFGSYASPDYFHTLGTVGSYFGTIAPFSGNAQMGFCTYLNSRPDFREYTSTQLACPILVGQQYQVSFYLSNGNNNSYSKGTNNIGIHFSSGPLTQIVAEPIPVIPQIEIPSITYINNSWQLFTYTITATATYNYITIGNFKDDDNTLISSFGSTGAYYFIDNIVVTNLSSLLNLGNDTIVCQGQSVTLNGGFSDSYLWSNGSTDSTISVSNSGTYWVQSNSGQCTNRDSINILFVPPTILNLGNDTTLCEGQAFTLNGGSASSYLWSNGSTTSSVSISTSGTYWLELNSGQCSNRDSINIIFNSSPTVNFDNDTILCEGQSITLNGGLADSYLWSTGSTDSTISVFNSGAYWVQSNIGQCANRDSINITFIPTTNLNLGNDTILCEGQVFTLNGGLADSYLWSNDSTSSSVNISTSGTYWLELNSGQCTNRDSINITFNSSPTVNLDKDTILCQGQSITLNGGLADSYLWSNNSTSSSLSVSTSGAYWVQLNLGVCSNRDSINITFNSLPIANLGIDTTLCEGQIYTLVGGSATSYLWSDSSTNSSISVSDPGTYWLKVSNGQCTASDTLEVFLSDCEFEIELANVFTPNFDGENDNFIPIKYKGISKASLSIYNKWGEELFVTDNLILGWNGYYKNNICSDGVYFWIVNYTTIKNESNHLQGFLTLVK